MILEATSKNPVNVSPYGEWRWSPMGLAGRDPIFYAQLDSEIAYLRKEKTEKEVQATINLCLSCHGVMGKRQLNLDHNYLGNSGSSNPKEPDFKLDFVYNTDLNDPNFKYGALARDGVSCMACHHIIEDKTPPGADPLKYFLENSITGQFRTGKPDELLGPFKDDKITPYPMKTSLGVTPKFDKYIKDSRMCGSCHAIDLPVVDGRPGQMHLEQSTYIEWLNSEFQTEYSPGPKAKSCQDCHMPAGYANRKNNVNIPQIESVIADIQDESYPMSEHRASENDVRVRYRKGVVAKGEEGFVRHQLQGLNVFLIEMFNNFMARDTATPPNYSNEILGVRKSDYMSTLNNDLVNAIANFVQQAQNDTATIEISPPKIASNLLSVDVKITNNTGHRFPSGVGFRRAFVEFDVIDQSNGVEKVLWSSGRTNDLGFIVDKDGNILDSEYVGTNTAKGNNFQPHYYDADNHRITRSSQVQIFEELVKDASHKFTTSFLRIDEEFKDNRLLPKGWSPQGPTPSLTGKYLEITFPKGDAANDPNYRNGSGTSIIPYRIPVSELRGVDPSKLVVKAILYYQAIPPYYLMQRFEQAPEGDGTRRLYYLTSNMKLKGTVIENWKLPLVSASAPMIKK
jgi:cytochrome c553